MNRLSKIISTIMLLIAVVIAIGCTKTDEPNDGGGNGNNNGNGDTPETPAIVSTSEVQYDGTVFIEAVFEDETKMYFEIVSPNEVALVSGEFYYQDNPSLAYMYRGEVVIPETITHLGATYSVVSIAKKAFYHNEMVTAVYIPNTVTAISSCYKYPLYYPNSCSNTFGAFQGCSNLERIQMSTNIISIGDMAFAGCPCFAKEVNISNHVKSIGKGAFDSKIVSFNADSCFIAGDMEPGNSTDQIYISAFPNMESIGFGNNVKIMPAYLFLGMNPSTIDIPSSVTILPYEAFRGCSNLEEVNNVENIVNIGAQAFLRCESLNSFPVTLNSALTFVGRSAFCGCKNLSSIAIPNSVITIGSSAFCNTGVCSIEWGNSVDTIGSSAFSSCRRLKEVVIPNSVTTIGSSAFRSCDSLSSLAIGNSVVTIESNAFEGCRSLTDISLPSSIRIINNHAFDDVMSSSVVTTITCIAINPPVLGEEVFGKRPIRVIYVPAVSVEAYKAADGWSKYADVIVGI